MFLRYNSLGILWAIFILVICILPPSGFPADPPFKYFDKTVHFYLFLQLSLLLITGFKKQHQYKFLRKKALAYAFFLSVAYGILIELLQGFVFTGRQIEFMDLVANFSGTIFGIVAFLIIYGKTSN